MAVVVLRTSRCRDGKPEWLILDATVGGFNNNLIHSTTVFPEHFQVDYVHAYS